MCKITSLPDFYDDFLELFDRNKFNMTTNVSAIDFPSLIEKYIAYRKSVWTDSIESTPWWAVWRTTPVLSMSKFLMQTLDQLIPYFAQFNDVPGVKKKELVMIAMGELYDFLSFSCFPIWLKAVSPMLRGVVLNQVISPSIDWIVEKYKNSNPVGCAEEDGVIVSLF